MGGDQIAVPSRRLTWWQFALPLLVVGLLFAVVLPKFIDYASVWDAIRSLSAGHVMLLILMGVVSSWSESAVYTAFIPGLGYLPGWRAFLGGNTVAGFAPSPWDIVVRYVMYRGFGVDTSVAGASVVVGGGFQITFSIVAPVLMLSLWVMTGQATEGAQLLTGLAVAAVVGAVILVALILRRKRIAVKTGVLLQRAADWALPKLNRPVPQDVVRTTVQFRQLLIESLASRW